MRWHLVGGEYPPSCGGVGDYTALLASALADAGDRVDVWVPSVTPSLGGAVAVHTLPDTFGPLSRAMLAESWRRDPGIVLLQYVPNALGTRGANLAFCRWLASERRAGSDVRIMFHEPYFYFSARRPWRNALAIVQRRMAAALIRAATHIYYSSETWGRYLTPYGASDAAIVLPIPSTVHDDAPFAAVTDFRTQFGGGAAPVVGHFGTFGGDMAGELLPCLAEIIANTRANVALIGDRSLEFQQAVAEHVPAGRERFRSTGRLDPERVAAALRACDVLIQPYPDGVTTRRTTVMAALSNGVPTVTTDGSLTEAVWRKTHAAVLVPARHPHASARAISELLSNAAARREQGLRGRDVYARHFSMKQTIVALRQSDDAVATVAR